MKLQPTRNLPKALLLNCCICFGVYVSGQTSNSEFNAFLKEKQRSIANGEPEPQNLLEGPLDSAIRDLIIPEWNFKARPSALDTVRTPVPIVIKTIDSTAKFINHHVVGELLNIELIQSESQLPVIVKLYDMYGKVFYNTTILSRVAIDIELYPPGTYILYATSSGTINQFVKIVIQ